MKKKIQQSISFLIIEYKRLKKKQEEIGLTEEEKETLEKLSIFIGRDKE